MARRGISLTLAVLGGLGWSVSHAAPDLTAPAMLAGQEDAGPERIARTSAAGSHLCLPGETIAYSCDFGKSLGSVCLDEKGVTYRFGTPDSIEKTIGNGVDWGNIHVGSVRGQIGGSQEHVRFTDGQYHYIVFTGVNGEATDNPGHSYSGISVVDSGKDVVRLECRSRPFIASNWTDKIIEAAPGPVRESLMESEDSQFDGWF
ncbi:MAG: hypothetical protein ACK5NN_06820 [Sphingomonadaceae bacterium]